MRRLILFLGVVTLVTACFLAWPRYQHYRQDSSLRRARAFLGAGDFLNASLSARQVLQADNRNLEACRLMAELAEACRSPAALDWRQRVVELAPTLQNRFKLAATAVRVERPPYPLTTQALRQLQPLANETAAFHSLAAELALKLNQVSEATGHFEKAVSLEPTNQLYRFNLAVLRLQSTNHPVVALARFELERLSTNSNLSLLALRWRVAEMLRQKNLDRAEHLSGQVLACHGAALQDRLQHLTILQLERSPSFGGYLREIQSGAALRVVDIFSVCQWMGDHGVANEAMSWLAGFDAKTREVQPLPLAMANLYLARGDWEGMETYLAGRHWAELEFLRLAYLARAAFGQQHETAGEARWHAAVQTCVGRLGPLSLLLGLETEWGRDPEDLLWEIGRRFPREQWALLDLEKRYFTAGNTRGLNKIYSLLTTSGTSDADPRNQNNFASSALLLKINLPQAHQTAAELYRRQPDDPMIGSTYAYSLHLQGRTQDGLAVFARFTPAALEIPSIALYYGVLLSRAGHPEQAARCFALAETANLLPEERQLLADARSGRP